MPTTNTITIWIHGHSMQIEDGDAIAALWRSGFCIYIEGKSDSLNWLHAAIPTPAIIDGIRRRIAAIMLICRTMSPDSIVRDIHVYDGDTKIGDFNELNLSGDIGLLRIDIPEQPEIQGAIGLSLGLSFGVELLAHGMSVTAVGAEFV